MSLHGSRALWGWKHGQVSPLELRDVLRAQSALHPLLIGSRSLRGGRPRPGPLGTLHRFNVHRVLARLIAMDRALLRRWLATNAAPPLVVFTARVPLTHSRHSEHFWLANDRAFVVAVCGYL